VTFESYVFGLTESVQDITTDVLVHVFGKSPGSHILDSTLLAIRIADKSEIALGGEPGA
jgi:hypothetical protein